MGFDLSGIGTLLRRGVDDVGSFFTGQPAQSNPGGGSGPTAPSTPQPSIQAPQQNQGGQLQVRPLGSGPQIGQNFNPQLPTNSFTSSPNIYKATPLPVGVAHPGGLQVGNQTIAPGGGATAPPSQPDTGFFHDITHNPVTNFVGTAGKDIANAAGATATGIGQIASIPYNAAKTDIGQFTGNQQATANAAQATNRDLHTGAQFLQFLPRAGMQLRDSIAEGLGGNGGTQQLSNFIPHPGLQQTILGDQPIQSLQQVYKDTRAQQGTQQAVANTALTAGLDALAFKGGVDGGVKLGARGADLATSAKPLNEIGGVGKDVNPAADAANTPLKLSANEATPTTPGVHNLTEPPKLSLVNDTLPRSQQSGLALSKPSDMTPEAYASAFNVPLKQAQLELNTLGGTDALGRTPKAQAHAKGVSDALNTLQNGGIKSDAIQAYKAATGASDTKASIEVTKAAKDAKQALRPNKDIPNPITKQLPEVAPGDYGQARTNPKIVENGITNEGKLWVHEMKQLSPEEQANFWHSIEDPTQPRSPKVQSAIDAFQKGSDTVHAYDMALGGKTRHIENYALHGQFDLEDPKTNELYGKLLQERSIKDTDPNSFNGYRNQPRIFATRAEQEAYAAQNGLKMLPSNPLQEGADYFSGAANALKKEALIKGAEKAERNGEPATKQLDIGMVRGKPTSLSLSEKGAKELKGYANPVDVNKLHSGYRSINRGLKANILGASGYHTTNINLFQAFPALLNHPILATKGLFEGTVGLFSDNFTHNIIKQAVDSGLADKMARINSPLRDGSDFSTNGSIKLAGKGNFFERKVFDNSIALMHARMGEGMIKDLEKHNVSLDSPRARAAGTAVNHTMGLVNQELQNLRPGLQRAISDVAFAPQFTRSKFAVYKDLFKGNEATSQAARTIAGKYIMEATLAITIGALVKQKQDSVRDSLIRTLVHPAIETNQNDGHGGKVEFRLPANIISEAAGLVSTLKRNNKGNLQLTPATPTKIASNVNNYGTNRLAVLPGLVQKDINNKQFNGQPIRDPAATIPQQIIQTVANNASGLLPITLQGLPATGPVNNAIKYVSPTAATALKQGQVTGNPLANSALSSLAATPSTSKTTGMPEKTTQFVDQRAQLLNIIKSGKWSQLDPSLPNVDPKTGQEEAAKYTASHPVSVKDFAGDVMPKEWNALSAEQKASYYLRNDQKTGAQNLSPQFFIDQKLSQLDPSRPHSALFDLNGNDGVNFTLDKSGNVVGTSQEPRAQVALDYQNMSPTNDQRALLLAANGGATGWLAGYEKQVGEDAKNYVPNMTTYLQNNGYSPDAIKQYFAQHPSNPPVIAPPQFSPETQKLMDQYGAITDPTEKAQFFQDNAAELSRAFAADATYKNQKAVAGGGLPLQDHPTPTPEQSAALAQLQKNPNHDKAIGKANALLIQAHPELAQYLADSGLFNTAKDLAKYQFQDPAHPGLNQGQLLNLGRPIDQSTLSGITNLGKYDISKDKNGTFSFLGAGGTGKFADGSASGSGGSGGSHYTKYAKNIKIRNHYVQPIHYVKPKREHHTKSFTLKTPVSHLAFNNKSKQTLRIADDSKSHIKLG